MKSRAWLHTAKPFHVAACRNRSRVVSMSYNGTRQVRATRLQHLIGEITLPKKPVQKARVECPHCGAPNEIRVTGEARSRLIAQGR
jgi:hypothetical protein